MFVGSIERLVGAASGNAGQQELMSDLIIAFQQNKPRQRRIDVAAGSLQRGRGVSESALPRQLWIISEVCGRGFAV